jgi:hypothetical protein
MRHQGHDTEPCSRTARNLFDQMATRVKEGERKSEVSEAIPYAVCEAKVILSGERAVPADGDELAAQLPGAPHEATACRGTRSGGSPAATRWNNGSATVDGCSGGRHRSHALEGGGERSVCAREEVGSGRGRNRAT